MRWNCLIPPKKCDLVSDVIDGRASNALEHPH